MHPAHLYGRFGEGADELAAPRPSLLRIAATLLAALAILLSVPLLFAPAAFAGDDDSPSTHATRQDSSGHGSGDDDDDDDDDNSGTGSDGNRHDGTSAATSNDAATTTNGNATTNPNAQVPTTREGNTNGDRGTREGNTNGATTHATKDGNTRNGQNTRNEGPGQTTQQTKDGNTHNGQNTTEGNTNGPTTRD
jgi:hypothetical protein